MNIADTFARLMAADAEIDEQILPPGRIAFEPRELIAGDRRYPLSERAVEQLCRRVGAPGAYVAALAPALQAQVLGYHINKGDLGEAPVSLIIRDQELVGFARADLVRLSGQDVMEAVVEGIGRPEDDLEVSGLSIGDDACRINVVVKRASSTVKPGDVIQAGVQVSHSLIGEAATKIDGYLLRLVCRNGLTYRECVGARRVPRTRRLPVGHPQAREMQLEQVRRLAREALAALNTKLNELAQLTTERVDFRQLTENWLRRSRLSPARLVPVLERAWEQEGAEPTAYSVMNAFTRAATHHDDLTPRIRDTLARLGGLLAFRHQHLCPRCFALAD